MKGNMSTPDMIWTTGRYDTGSWNASETRMGIPENAYLLSTPAREHADELVEALREVEDDYCDAAAGRTDMHCAWLEQVRALLSKLDRQNTGETDAD